MSDENCRLLNANREYYSMENPVEISTQFFHDFVPAKLPPIRQESVMHATFKRPISGVWFSRH